MMNGQSQYLLHFDYLKMLTSTGLISGHNLTYKVVKKVQMEVLIRVTVKELTLAVPP